MVKNIVFDMGNVITKFDPDAYAGVFAEGEKHELLKKTVFDSDEWQMLDKGVITYDYACSVWQSRESSIKDEIRLLCDHWHEHKILVPYVNKLALALKDKGYKLYLLSNVSDKFPLYRNKVPALRALDGWILSYECHILKPDKGIYLKLFETYALTPEDCFFIDDIARNVEVGRELGMDGYVYPKDMPETDAVKGLISALNLRGVDVSMEDLLRYECERTF